MRRLGYVLLCLVMWRGPVPCVHHHPAEGLGAELIRHLAIYEHDASESGWHFHFVFPWTSHESDDDGDRAPDSDPVIAGRLVLPDGPVVHAFALDCLAEPPVSATLTENPAHAVSPRPSGEAATFIGSLLARAPLCAVFGVALN